MTIGVGIVGTGYAATKRAEAVVTEGARAQLVAVAGTPDRAQALAQRYGAQAWPDWRQLVGRDGVDLVIVATVNAWHSDVVEAALQVGHPVVVEYPLAVSVSQAQHLAQLATAQHRLLHVEHIELLGGLHQSAKANLERIGQPQTARYTTLAPQHPAPQKWSSRLDRSGFPLVAALSRVSRLVDLFGQVSAVTCQRQFDAGPGPYYQACLCEATLHFSSGVVAELVYGKGARDWPRTRRLTISGTQGDLQFDGDQGSFRPNAQQAPATPPQTIDVRPRRGLFLQDTQQVLDHLLTGSPLWPPLSHSLYTLAVADALRRATETGQRIALDHVQRETDSSKPIAPSQ